MIFLVVIGSWRARVALLWLAHRAGLSAAPMAVLGVWAALGRCTPLLVAVAAWWTTSALLLLKAAGGRLHRELGGAGIPCYWCPAGVSLAGPDASTGTPP
ncbi:hypothetical protein [Streptomyces sp. NPDC003660]